MGYRWNILYSCNIFVPLKTENRIWNVQGRLALILTSILIALMSNCEKYIKVLSTLPRWVFLFFILLFKSRQCAVRFDILMRKGGGGCEIRGRKCCFFLLRLDNMRHSSHENNKMKVPPRPPCSIEIHVSGIQSQFSLVDFSRWNYTNPSHCSLEAFIQHYAQPIQAGPFVFVSHFYQTDRGAPDQIYRWHLSYHITIQHI